MTIHEARHPGVPITRYRDRGCRPCKLRPEMQAKRDRYLVRYDAHHPKGLRAMRRRLQQKGLL